MVKEWGAPIGNQYYRSLMPDFPISLCGSCNKVSYISPSIPILSHMHTHTYMHAGVSLYKLKNHCCEIEGDLGML